MNVMLLLGSGISRPTWENSALGRDIPDLAGLTRSVLSGSWQREGEIFVPRSPNDPPCQDADRCQRFLQRLTCSVSPYYKERRGAVNYEDLFYLTDQLRSTMLNPTIQSFVQQMRATCGDLCWRPPSRHAPFDFDDLCGQVCDFIRCVVWTQLNRKPTPHGMDLILDLARKATACTDIKRLAICTLNHDLLLEQLLNETDYEDGFGDPGKSEFFDTNRFRRPVPVRLLKLHGSINWFRYQRREGEHYSDHYATHGPRWEPPLDGDGVTWYCEHIPRILTGSYNKIEAYGTDIIKEFMYAFHTELAEHQLIVMSGYGWGDYAINQRLCEWVGRTKANRIVLLHKDDPISILEPNHIIWHTFERLIRLRKLVVIRKWLQQTKWTEIAERIAEEDSLPPSTPPTHDDFLRHFEEGR